MYTYRLGDINRSVTKYDSTKVFTPCIFFIFFSDYWKLPSQIYAVEPVLLCNFRNSGRKLGSRFRSFQLHTSNTGAYK